MANKRLFSTSTASKVPAATTVNKAGGRAYSLTDAEALCQYAVTSTFNNTYYSSGKEQLDEIKRLALGVDSMTLAKAAIYGHESGKMKDAPAFLLAVLAARGETELLAQAFPRVIKSPKMLLNFVQIVRSGVTGRKSFGTAVKKLIQNWITSRRGNQLFIASKGYSDPALVDVIKMVHPRPSSEEQNALFGYLLGKDFNAEALPPLVTEFEAFKADNSQPLPNMDYRSLTNCKLTSEHWKQIAQNMPWNTLRMNLNTLARNGVFTDSKVTEAVAAKLGDAEEVKRWNAFPYQIYNTFLQVDASVPAKVKLSLQKALDLSMKNVPVLGDRVAVIVDVSGSMSSAITGDRGSVTSTVRCIDVAALIAAGVSRTNPETDVVAFGTTARYTKFNPLDSISSIATYLATQGNYCGHGTNASSALEAIRQSKKKYDVVIMVSDCQTWADGTSYGWAGTSVAHIWAEYKRAYSKNAKFVELNVQPYAQSLHPSQDKSVMRVAGFSDSVFDIIKEFSGRSDDGGHFAKVVSKVQL